MNDVTIERMLSDFGVTHPEAQRSAVEALVKAGVLSGRPTARASLRTSERGWPTC